MRVNWFYGFTRAKPHPYLLKLFCSPFQASSSVAVRLCASVASYVAFVWSMFVPLPPFFWCIGKAVFLGCGIFWVSSLKLILLFHCVREKYEFVHLVFRGLAFKYQLTEHPNILEEYWVIIAKCLSIQHFSYSESHKDITQKRPTKISRRSAVNYLISIHVKKRHRKH